MKTNKNEAVRYNLDYDDVNGIENYENTDINKNKYKDIKRNISLLDKLPTVCGYKLYHKELSNNNIKDYFINKEKEMIIAVVFYKKINNDMMEEFKWHFNTIDYKGIVTKIYLEHYLNKYTKIISDWQLSDPAFNSWKNKVKLILESKRHAALTTFKGEIITELSLKNYDNIMNMNFQPESLEDLMKLCFPKFTSLSNEDILKLNVFDRKEYLNKLNKKRFELKNVMGVNKNRFAIYK